MSGGLDSVSVSAPPATASIDLDAPAALERLVNGYKIAQAVYVAARLGVADRLADGPRTVAELARTTDTHAPSLSRLLRALAAFGVLDQVAQDQFALTSMGACLRTDAPNSIRDGVLMWGSPNFWQTITDLLHCVQTGETALKHLFGAATPFAYYQQHPELAATMNAGWAALGGIRARAVVAAYDFSSCRLLVDVGGNRGQLLAPILQAYPALRGVLFDLPHVVVEAAPFLERAGVVARCRVEGGDMFAEIPSGGDTYLLSAVLHDWEDEQALAILRSCRRVMAPGATLLLVERVLPAILDRSAASQEAVLGDLTMLLRTGGRERTDAEYAALLAAAGFTLERIIPAPAGYSVIKSTVAEASSSGPSLPS